VQGAVSCLDICCPLAAKWRRPPLETLVVMSFREQGVPAGMLVYGRRSNVLFPSEIFVGGSVGHFCLHVCSLQRGILAASCSQETFEHQYPSLNDPSFMVPNLFLLFASRARVRKKTDPCRWKAMSGAFVNSALPFPTASGRSLAIPPLLSLACFSDRRSGRFPKPPCVDRGCLTPLSCRFL